MSTLNFEPFERIEQLERRIEELEEVCKRDRFADGYAAGCEDFKRAGSKRIEALEAALREIANMSAETQEAVTTAEFQIIEPWKIARAALDKDAGQ